MRRPKFMEIVELAVSIAHSTMSAAALASRLQLSEGNEEATVAELKRRAAKLSKLIDDLEKEVKR